MRKSIGRFFGWVGLIICSAIIKITPKRALYGVANVLAVLGYFLLTKQRQIALESLRIAFGNEKNDTQIKNIAKTCFSYMAKSIVELLFVLDRPEIVRDKVSLVNKEHLDAALAKGNGVILVSAHFGNFPLLLGRLSLEGYVAAGIMRPMRDERVEKFFQKKRDRFKVKTIYSQPRNVCVNQTIETLRHNGLVFIPVDQNFGTAGVFVEFFGVKAATATGPIILAQRTKAALVPCFIIRQPDDTHRIVFEPAEELIQGKDSQETILLSIQRLTNIIEKYIRQYPAEWGWIHRRWKSRPKEV